MLEYVLQKTKSVYRPENTIATVKHDCDGTMLWQRFCSAAKLVRIIWAMNNTYYEVVHEKKNLDNT